MASTHFGWNTPFAFADTTPGALAVDVERRGMAIGPPLPAENQGSGDSVSDSDALRFDHALGLLEAGAWSEGFVALGALADRGHPAAARIALMLARRGTALFGGHFPASRQERQRWQHFSA